MLANKSAFLRHTTTVFAITSLVCSISFVGADEYTPIPELERTGVYDGGYTTGELMRYGLATPSPNASAETKSLYNVAVASGVADELFGRDNKSPELQAVRDSLRRRQSDRLEVYLNGGMADRVEALNLKDLDAPKSAARRSWDSLAK